MPKRRTLISKRGKWRIPTYYRGHRKSSGKAFVVAGMGSKYRRK